MTTANESRPAVSHEAARANHINAIHDTAISRPVFAVLVRRELASGGVRTYIYRTVAPAERAVARARKQGLAAMVELRLVQLVPIEWNDAAASLLEGGERE